MDKVDQIIVGPQTLSTVPGKFVFYRKLAAYLFFNVCFLRMVLKKKEGEKKERRKKKKKERERENGWFSFENKRVCM